MGTHHIFESDFDCLTDMKVVPRRKPEKKDNPPVLSNDWIIQNHGDIAACVAVFFVLGLMFQTTKKAANYFIALQYAQIDEEKVETSVQTQNEAHNDFDKAINLGAGTFARQQLRSVPNNKIIYHQVGIQDMA